MLKSALCLLLLIFLSRLYLYLCPQFFVRHVVEILSVRSFTNTFDSTWLVDFHRQTPSCIFWAVSSQRRLLVILQQREMTDSRTVTLLPCSSGVTLSQTTMVLLWQLCGPTCCSLEVRGHACKVLCHCDVSETFWAAWHVQMFTLKQLFTCWRKYKSSIRRTTTDSWWFHSTDSSGQLVVLWLK